MSSASSAVTYTLSYHDLSRVGYFGELTRSCRTVVLHESSYTDTTRITMQHWAGPHLHKDYIPGSRGHKTTTSTPQDEYYMGWMLSCVSAEEQPLPPVVSPTAESPRYVVESDPEKDPEEYDDDETEDGPVDYPMDGGEDGDDDDGDSPGDDTDDEDEDEEDEDEEDEEEEEHLAPADSAVVVPTIELVSPPERTEPVTPSPSTDPLLPLRLDILSGFRLPYPFHQRQSALARITSTQALIDAVTAALPSPPLPPSLYIPLPVDRKDDIPESEQPPRKRLCLSTLGSRYEIRKSSTARPTRDRGVDYGFFSTVDVEARWQGISEVGYGIRDTWVDPAEAVPEIAPMTVDRRTAYSQRVTLAAADRLAYGDMIVIRIQYDCGGKRPMLPEGLGLIRLDTAPVMRDMRREMGDMQVELLALREHQRRARQPGPDVRVPDHQDASRDADSHIS
ncbi:hypothetical protein Tco_0305301 [Tanacetum coccineum]